MCTCCTLICKFDSCVNAGGCDYLCLLPDNVIVLAELKGGDVDVADVDDALREHSICEHYVKKLSLGNNVLKVIIYGKRLDSRARNKLARNGVIPVRSGHDICKAV